MGALLYILCTFLFLKILRSATIKLKLCFLKKEIKKNPLIGEKDLDGTLLYKKNGYTLRYSIEELPSGEKKIQWVSYKFRLTALEEFIYKIKIFFQRFILYSRFKPSLIFSFFLIIIIVYTWIITPESKKIEFYKFAISRMTRIKPENIEYRGGGWFEVYGKRIMPKAKSSEPLIFTINPLRWLFLGDYGYVTRWRGKDSGGYKTHELNRVIPIHGKLEGDKIKWDRPLETGSTTQDIEIKKEGISIIDR